MLINQLPKPKKKSKKGNTVSKYIMDIVTERSKGICEYCHSREATDPHHIKLKSQGGLDIPLNLLHVCRICHNHSNTKFIQDAKEILLQRIKELKVIPIEHGLYSISAIIEALNMSINVMFHQIFKGFLHTQKVELYDNNYKLQLTIDACEYDDIVRWLI